MYVIYRMRLFFSVKLLVYRYAASGRVRLERTRKIGGTDVQ